MPSIPDEFLLEFFNVEISVIIPTRNRLESLKRVLPIFLMQDEVKEVVVIIDGSTDGTREFLNEYCRNNSAVRFLDNEINRGIPFSRNRGIDAAQFEYIFMAEDDLELTNGFFRTLSDHMAAIGADVMCGRNIFRRDTESAADSIMRTDKLKGTYVNEKTIEIETGMDIGSDQESPIIASPMLALASLFREVRYNEIYQVNYWREETDFQLSARERGYKLGSCPHAICFNFEISNDRGGVHGAVGFRREKWVIVNNWRFIEKHEGFIRENFKIGNKWCYIFKFAVGRIVKYIFLPPVINLLIRIKQKILKTRSALID